MHNNFEIVLLIKNMIQSNISDLPTLKSPMNQLITIFSRYHVFAWQDPFSCESVAMEVAV